MKAYHAVLIGDSGGGKTTKAREYQATADAASLYMTSKRSESNVSGKRVRGMKALRTAVGQAKRPSDVRCKWFGADYPDDVETAREWAHDIREHRGWSTQIIIDEAHAALPDRESVSGSEAGNPLAEGLKEDRDLGIKYVLASQDPQDLYYPPLKQCRWYVWVGIPSPLHRGFVDYWRLPADELPTEDYQVVVFEKGASMSWSVAHRGKTNERYA